jgi:hypothetical protein
MSSFMLVTISGAKSLLNFSFSSHLLGATVVAIPELATSFDVVATESCTTSPAAGLKLSVDPSECTLLGD